MTLFGTLMLFILVLWTFVSLLLMRGFANFLEFMRSMNFAVVCIVYIVILTLFYVLKNVFREYEEE